jgi:ATP-binding protein involved in chromosome partitioning
MLTEEQKQHIAIQNKKMSETMQKIKHRIVVFSGKGGVGKTFVSVNLSYSLYQAGYKTGILDADVTGPNVPKMTGAGGELSAIDNRLIPVVRNGVEIISVAYMLPASQPVMWRGPMRSKLLYQFLGDVDWGNLDFLVADLPPGTGDEIITLSDKMMPELAIIVSTPQELALLDSGKSINMAKELKISKIGVIENMSGLVCPKCGHKIDLFGAGGAKKQAQEMGVKFLGAISIDIEARKFADCGLPIILERPDSIISHELKAIAENIEILMAR